MAQRFLQVAIQPVMNWLSGWARSGTFVVYEQVAELVAIGAAIGANCEPCFKYHYDQARKLGVSNLDMRFAVDLAQKVKDTPARTMLELAERYLGLQRTQLPRKPLHVVSRLR